MVVHYRTEDEYRALLLSYANCFGFILLSTAWTWSLSTQSLTDWCDSIGATYVSTNPVFHGQSKNVQVDIHFIHYLVSNCQLYVRYVSTHGKVVDIFIKPFISSRFDSIQAKLTVLFWYKNKKLTVLNGLSCLSWLDKNSMFASTLQFS